MDAKLKSLIYGDPGSGKTYLIGTFGLYEETAPVLVLNSRGQPITYNLFGAKMPCIVDMETMADYNIPYAWIIHGQPWSTIETGCDVSPPVPFCVAVKDYFMNSGCHWYGLPEGERKFKAVALDSLTQTQRISLREAGGGQLRLPGDAPLVTTRQMWGATLGQMTNLADLFYQLDVHVIVTALRRHQFVENMGITMFYPFFWGQSALEVPSYAEMLAMLVNIDSLDTQRAMAVRETLEKSDGEGAEPFNALLCRGGRTFNAKWQGVKHPPAVLANPTGEKLYRILNG